MWPKSIYDAQEQVMPSPKCTCKKCGHTYTHLKKEFILVNEELICCDCYYGRETKVELSESKVRYFPVNNGGAIQYSSQSTSDSDQMKNFC